MKTLALLLAALSVPGCMIHMDNGTPGSGKVVTDSRSVSGFESISSRLPSDVTVTVGPAYSVKVTVDDNLTKHVITKVVGNRLVIESDQSINPSKMKIEITMPNIVGYEIEGAGDASIQGVKAGSFHAKIEGAGTIKVAGKADSVVLKIEGAGDIQAYDLQAKTGKAHIEGAGSIQVHATSALDAIIDGAGDIHFKGDPKVNRTIDGAGSISKG